MLNRLKPENGFISISQSEILDWDKNWFSLSNQSQIRMADVGIVQIKPAQQSDQAIVISCGIHGNETAPIEIVSKLISRIVNNELDVQVNLLFVLGNPQAMKIGQRFVSINMNRLFNAGYKKYTLDQNNQYELQRAQVLENHLIDFFKISKASKKMHLDLHTAIKPSLHKTFAIRPFSKADLLPRSKQFLSSMGIEALLQHNKPSTTFSAFSVDQFNAEAYTLELGKVKAFGENNLQDFVAAINCLENLIQNKPIENKRNNSLIKYEVVAEIIRQSEKFKFYVKNNVENFTRYSKGFLIANDSEYSYRVSAEQEAVVFPNVDVPVGQRVAVMVKQVN